MIGMPGFTQATVDSMSEEFADSIIIQDKSFKYMSSLDSVLRRINRETDSLNKARALSGSSKKRNFSLSGTWADNIVLRIAFWVVIGLFILFVLYKLFGVELFSSRHTIKKQTGDEAEEELKIPEWYQDQIARAESDGDYMLATRYQFMRVLAIFNDKGLIQYLPEKTNTVYADEIQNDILKERFRRLSSIYEYVWYGVHKISSEQYASVKNLFTQTIELV